VANLYKEEKSAQELLETIGQLAARSGKYAQIKFKIERISENARGENFEVVRNELRRVHESHTDRFLGRDSLPNFWAVLLSPMKGCGPQSS